MTEAFLRTNTLVELWLPDFGNQGHTDHHNLILISLQCNSGASRTVVLHIHFGLGDGID